VIHSCTSPLTFTKGDTSNGYVAYYATEIFDHVYSAGFVWSDDGTACTVNLVCVDDPSHTVSFQGEVTSSVISNATFSSPGIMRYAVSGSHSGASYHDTKDVAFGYVPKQTSGVAVYEDTISSGMSNDVTDLFDSAKGDSGRVEITSDTDAGRISIQFDGDAVGSIGGNVVSMNVKVTDMHVLGSSELRIEITLDGAEFSAGTATVTMDFDREVPSGKIAKVYFVDGDSREDMRATFADGKVTFTARHFSVYEVVFEDEPAADSDDKPGFPIAFAAAGGVAVLALVGVALILIRRRA